MQTQVLNVSFYTCRICGMNYIQAAIQGAGGPAKVAQELSVSVQAVCFWRDGKRSLPAEHCPVLERMNSGAIRCEQMRPDVDWAYVRNSTHTATSVPDTQSEQQQAA